MHTENNTPRVEAFIRTYRARLAYGVAAALTVLAYIAWVFVSAAIRVQSPTLDLAVLGIAAFGSAIAALAFYWGAE